MRVIAGSAKGTKLIAPNGTETRPTVDRIKETIFNIIAPMIYDSAFLDLFSGTGAIGIEALSRGAKYAVFVENNKDCIVIMSKNLDNAKFVDRAQIVNATCESAIRNFTLQNKKFDIIFLDPPYNKNCAEQTIEAIMNGGILNDEGLLIVEQATTEPKPIFNSLEIVKEKKYKTTSVYFLKKLDA